MRFCRPQRSNCLVTAYLLARLSMKLFRCQIFARNMKMDQLPLSTKLIGLRRVDMIVFAGHEAMVTVFTDVSRVLIKKQLTKF